MYTSYNDAQSGWNNSSQPVYTSGGSNTNMILHGPPPSSKSSSKGVPAKTWNSSYYLPVDNNYNWNINSPVWRGPHFSVPRKMRPPPQLQQNHINQQPPAQPPPIMNQQQITAPPHPSSLNQTPNARLNRRSHAPWTGIPWSTKMSLRHAPHSSTVVLKLSPLDFSFGSPIFQEFIHHVLPHWKAYVPDAQSYPQKSLFSTEVILHQSHLDSQSLGCLLDSLVKHNLIPSTLHLGSNPKLQETGILVLANYIRNSFSPLRSISFSKCLIPAHCFIPLFQAIIQNSNLYPRTNPARPVPIWIDLGTMDATEIFEQLDAIDYNLYCPAYDRTACGINRCKYMGIVMHLAVNTLQVNGNDSRPDKLETEAVEDDNIENESVLSKISSEDEEEEEIYIDSLYNVPPVEDILEDGVEKEVEDEVKNLDIDIESEMKTEDDLEEFAYLRKVYGLFLKKAYIDISLYATRRRILPSELLRHMYTLFVDKEPLQDLPNIWYTHSLDELQTIFIESEKEEEVKQPPPNVESTDYNNTFNVDREKEKQLFESFPVLDSLIRSFDEDLEELVNGKEETSYATDCIERQNQMQQQLIQNTTQSQPPVLDIPDSVPENNSYENRSPHHSERDAATCTRNNAPIVHEALIVENTELPSETLPQEVEEGEITDSSVHSNKPKPFKKRKPN